MAESAKLPRNKDLEAVTSYANGFTDAMERMIFGASVSGSVIPDSRRSGVATVLRTDARVSSRFNSRARAYEQEAIRVPVSTIMANVTSRPGSSR